MTSITFWGVLEKWKNGKMEKFRKPKWRNQDGRHLEMMSLLSRHVTSSGHVVDLQGINFERVMYLLAKFPCHSLN